MDFWPIHGWAVRSLGAPPVLYVYLGEVGRLVLLAPFVLARLGAGEPARTWRQSRLEAVGVAALWPTCSCSRPCRSRP